LRPYLLSQPFLVESDRAACQALFRQVLPNKRPMKWRLGLSDFDFSVRYRPGKENAATDAVSRMETLDIDSDQLDQDIPTLLVGLE
jgi:hypothetical protein